MAGKPEKISDELAAVFDISPDSKTIALAAFGHLGEHVEELKLLSLDSNQSFENHGSSSAREVAPSLLARRQSCRLPVPPRWSR